jgi:hypothetical protein
MFLQYVTWTAWRRVFSLFSHELVFGNGIGEAGEGVEGASWQPGSEEGRDVAMYEARQRLPTEC